ncbi:MAG TPA: hypothetical protein VG388_05030 [Solirubrobacteraceae bacterium]|nr:hypothetical protein [Solirubrobacteraceae bacterium]
MGDGSIRPNSGDLAAHDVLAAEEFALPAADPSIGYPVVLPDDPSGIAEPHDVLAAEEFALPASPAHPAGPVVPARRDARRAGAVLGIVALVIVTRILRGRGR